MYQPWYMGVVMVGVSVKELMQQLGCTAKVKQPEGLVDKEILGEQELTPSQNIKKSQLEEVMRNCFTPESLKERPR